MSKRQTLKSNIPSHAEVPAEERSGEKQGKGNWTGLACLWLASQPKIERKSSCFWNKKWAGQFGGDQVIVANVPPEGF